ncbi:hypothetical protein B0H13DRAFT_2005402 [Mycena leptocephala]|nr:hypothetical protein B0H13DRAFT_2005402 [Mycena leptocephala]
MSFLLLPLDVLLEICTQLDLGDTLVLLSSCTTLRQILAEKSFWLRALARVRRMQMHPIAVPIRQDLSGLTLAELQEAGKRTNRLIKNWFNEAPRPESLREMYMDAMAEIIVIPGTGLVIAHGPAFVSCWDIRTKSCVGRLVVHRHLSIDSAAFEEYGMVILGAYIQNTSLSIMAISIDYIDPTAVSISVLLTHTFGLGTQHFHKASQVTVDHGTVRLIATSFEPYHYYLLSVSLAGEESVIENILPEVLRRSPLTWGPPTVCNIHSPAGPYFMRHMQRHADIVHLSTRTLDVGPSNSTVQLQLSNESRQLKSYPLADPVADIVTITAAQSAGRSIVEFWQARSENGGLAFGDVSSFFIDPAPSNVVAGASGIYALPTMGGGGGRSAPLRLLRYVPGGSTVLQELKVPGKTLYMNAGQVALDDHLGLVLSLRGDGTLRIISYA